MASTRATKTRHFRIAVLKISPWRKRVTLTVDGKVTHVKQGDIIVLTHTVNFTDGEG